MGGRTMATGTEILVLAGTVASGILILSVNRGLKMRDDRRPFAELLWYAGGLMPMAAVCLYWASMGDQPVMPQRVILFIIGAAIGGCALVGAGEWFRPATAVAQSGGNMPPIINNGPSISTTNQSGGTNTINVGPTRLLFDTAIGDELAGKLPTGKPVMLQTVGGNADQAIADQYQQYLESKGFQVARMKIGVMGPPPDHKITLGDPNAPQMVVIIAPSAN
jgi:hypothetical protein